jgi:hypothetical protein
LIPAFFLSEPTLHGDTKAADIARAIHDLMAGEGR